MKSYLFVFYLIVYLELTLFFRGLAFTNLISSKIEFF